MYINRRVGHLQLINCNSTFVKLGATPKLIANKLVNTDLKIMYVGI